MSTAVDLRSRAGEDTGIPRSWYLGDEWFERDLEAVFRPRWMVAGHVGQLPDDRSFITYALGPDECLIRRGQDGAVHAFYNVCSHRAARLCTERSGTSRTKTIVCPYHAWQFSADDGALRVATSMHEGFDPSHWGLRPVHVDEWLGFIFVCFADERPAPVAEYLRDVSFGDYDTKGMKLAASRTYTYKANWKIVAENASECYHCGFNHPEISTSIDWRTLASDDYDEHVAKRAAGLEVMVGETFGSARTINNKSICAKPLPRVGAADEVAPTITSQWEPQAGLALSPEHGYSQVVRPVSADETEVMAFWFVAEDAVEGVDYDLDEVMEFWDATLDQDRVLCENVQRGMAMTRYEPGPLNRLHQANIAGLYAWYRAQVAARFPGMELDPA